KRKIFLPLTLGVLMQNKSRLPELVGYMWQLLQTFNLFGYIWPLVIIFALARISRWKHREVIFLGLLCAAPLAVDIFIYVFSAWDPYLWHVRTSMDRLILHLLPIGVLLMGHLWGGGSDRSDQDSPLEASQ